MNAMTEAGLRTSPDGGAKEADAVRRYALLSVSDKAGIVDFADELTRLGYTVISTGGTGRALEAGGIPFVPIEEITGNPESFEGRMKTISFQVESGILFRRDSELHQKEAAALSIPRIDIVVCNLYPFEATVATPGVSPQEAVEQIDVGGPTMVRAAAKNHKDVLVVVDPADYAKVADALKQKADTPEFRQALAAKAFGHLSFYDAQIARFLSHEAFPAELTIPLRKASDLRYGDNADQNAVLYLQPGVDSPMGRLEQLAGRGLSETNITDIQAGMYAVRMHDVPAAVVIKHNSPCGIAVGADALSLAFDADPESAFGGVIVVNRAMTMADVEVIARFKQEGRGQMDIVAAPSFEDGVVDALGAVRKSTGVYAFGKLPPHSPGGQFVRIIDGAAVIQTENDPMSNLSKWEIKAGASLSEAQWEQAALGWKFVSRIRSNTIVIMDRNLPMTRGIGSGQTSRVRAARIALEQAGAYAEGATLISDGFLPFPDTVQLAATHGIKTIVQPAGSVSDEKVFEAARTAGITMVSTGQRLFWH